jgi:hypothetical protein
VKFEFLPDHGKMPIASATGVCCHGRLSVLNFLLHEVRRFASKTQCRVAGSAAVTETNHRWNEAPSTDDEFQHDFILVALGKSGAGGSGWMPLLQ